MSYFYGPVPSRRLGLSLGVDLLPKKSCSFDCLYCQLGPSSNKRLKRLFYIDIKKFKRELREIIKDKPQIDYITISGSGEPTLHNNLDKIIALIKKETKNRFPVCLITNSSLLYRKDVRREIKKADLIIPSLDAACAKTFYEINRPAKKIDFRKILAGLLGLRREFKGKIWLEIMLVKGVNDSLEEAEKFSRIIKKIKPDKVQLNIPVRPSALKLSLPDKRRILKVAKIISRDIEVVTGFPGGKREAKKIKNLSTKIINFLKVRPATYKDLANSLGVERRSMKLASDLLLKKSQIKTCWYNRKKYFTIYD